MFVKTGEEAAAAEVKLPRVMRVVSAKRREKEKMWPGLGDRS